MRQIFLAIFLFRIFIGVSQNAQMNAALRFMYENSPNNDLRLNILVEGSVNDLKKYEKSEQFKILYSDKNIASIECNYATLFSLQEKGLIQYAELPHSKKRPLNDTMIYRNRIKQVKVWTAPLTQAYNGEGVLIGIIDTGTDFNHPDFKDSLGLTRIQFLWDQSVSPSLNAPTPFNYGREWTAAEINAGQCSHSDAAYYGHGTHVSGIAAGNGRANGTHEGVASKADLIVVALDFNRFGPTIADAVKYIFSKAQQFNKACAINVSVGDYYGSHDATDLESKLIEAQLINHPGRALVAAAGNAGAYKFHVKTNSTANDTLFTWLNNNTSVVEYWCYGDTAQFKNLKISIGANRLNYSQLPKTPFRNYTAGLSSIKRDTIYANNKRIGIVEMSSSVNSSGVCEWYYKIRADSVNTFWRVETTGKGLHHAWNFDFVSSGLPSQLQYPKITKYLMPDTFYTMVSGFQNSEEVITVGNYVNMYRFKDYNNTIQSLGETGGKIAQTSSSGPTRDGRIKPDVCATGNSVFSAVVMSLKPVYISVQPQNVAPGGYHVMGGGTSAAAPVVAGLAALYLQKNPSASNRDVRDAIRYCAYQDAYTGSNVPNYQWGFGKLDGKASMTCNDIKVYTGIDAFEKNNIQFFPNPFKEQIQIKLNNGDGGYYEVYALNGDKICEGNFNSDAFIITSNKLSNYHGLLLINIQSRQEAYRFKIIKD